MQLYLHSPIHLPDIVLRQMDNFTSTLPTYLSGYNHSYSIRWKNKLCSKWFHLMLFMLPKFSLTCIFLCLCTGTGTGSGVAEGAAETACQLGGSHKNKNWNDC